MLYKYRTLNNFEFVLDIIVNQRLYAATFDSMNDPMEGFYTSNADVPEAALVALEDLKQTLKICSLTQYKDNPLMWAHYADGARGIAVGVEVNDGVDIRGVEYDSLSYLVAKKEASIERAKSVLTYKASYWRYEGEARVFVENVNFIYVEVKEVIFGEKVDQNQKDLLMRLIRAVDPNIKLIEWDESMVYVHTEPVYSKEYLKSLGSVSLENSVKK